MNTHEHESDKEGNMSVVGYLGKGTPELRMPKEDVDELGVRFEGVVLTGEKTVEEGLKSDVVRRVDECHECYERVEDYDPVLRAHCRR
jgi:hypothetical protein